MKLKLFYILSLSFFYLAAVSQSVYDTTKLAPIGGSGGVLLNNAKIVNGLQISTSLDTSNKTPGLIKQFGNTFWWVGQDGYYHSAYAGTVTNGWNLTGNTGSTYSNNFIGTKDNNGLHFRTNNIERLVIDSLGTVNVAATLATGNTLNVFGANAIKAYGNIGSDNNITANNSIISGGNMSAQSTLTVGKVGLPPAASAALDIVSSSRGIIIPRLVSYNLINKVLVRINVTNGGSGYGAGTAVSVSGFATAAIPTITGGVITSIAVPVNSDITALGTAPAVTISGGGGSGATAIAVIDWKQGTEYFDLTDSVKKIYNGVVWAKQQTDVTNPILAGNPVLSVNGVLPDAATGNVNVTGGGGGSGTTAIGTANRITVNSTTGAVDIAANYTGQTSINTVGIITNANSEWRGKVIADAYLASGSVWNSHLSNTANPHGVTAAQVNLGNVANLAPEDLPVSKSGKDSFNLKQYKITANGVLVGNGNGGVTAGTKGITYGWPTNSVASGMIKNVTSTGELKAAVDSLDFMSPGKTVNMFNSIFGTFKINGKNLNTNPYLTVSDLRTNLTGLLISDPVDGITVASDGTDYASPSTVSQIVGDSLKNLPIYTLHQYRGGNLRLMKVVNANTVNFKGLNIIGTGGISVTVDTSGTAGTDTIPKITIDGSGVAGGGGTGSTILDQTATSGNTTHAFSSAGAYTALNDKASLSALRNSFDGRIGIGGLDSAAYSLTVRNTAAGVLFLETESNNGVDVRLRRKTMPTAADQRFGRFLFDGPGYSNATASFNVWSSEAHTSNAHGGYVTLNIIPKGSVVSQEVIRYSGDRSFSTTGLDPDSSASADIGAGAGITKKGLLIPRGTAANRLAIKGPAYSLLFAQTDGGITQAGLWQYLGAWYRLGAPALDTVPVNGSLSGITSNAVYDAVRDYLPLSGGVLSGNLSILNSGKFVIGGSTVDPVYKALVTTGDRTTFKTVSNHINGNIVRFEDSNMPTDADASIASIQLGISTQNPSVAISSYSTAAFTAGSSIPGRLGFLTVSPGSTALTTRLTLEADSAKLYTPLIVNGNIKTSNDVYGVSGFFNSVGLQQGNYLYGLNSPVGMSANKAVFMPNPAVSSFTLAATVDGNSANVAGNVVSSPLWANVQNKPVLASAGLLSGNLVDLNTFNINSNPLLITAGIVRIDPAPANNPFGIAQGATASMLLTYSGDSVRGYQEILLEGSTSENQNIYYRKGYNGYGPWYRKITDQNLSAPTFSNQTANTVFAGPVSGSAAQPAFRTLVPADLPLATTTSFGAVRIGSGLSVTGGVLSTSSSAANGTFTAALGLASVVGTGATVSISGDDEHGTINVTTGTGVSNGGLVVTLTPSAALPTTSVMVISAGSPAAAGTSSQMYNDFNVGGTGNFRLTNSVTMQSGVSYIYRYIVNKK